jgi:glycosyltransferase involved in cell wall biosynthesis
VGYVGRLERRKGVHLIVEAIRSLPDDVRLEIHGSGPDEGELRSAVDTSGLTPRVTFHGYSDHASLPDVYRALDALVIPSQTTARWVEQFGRVAVEAMASGIPVVCSDSGALPEVVDRAAVVVPEADVAAWAAAIQRLRDDPAERARLAAGGLERARSFSWAAIAHEHGELYESVVAA